MILTIVIFIAILILLIMIHELGHFLIAKANKVKIKEFAFGFPPRIASIVKHGTRYAINAIPLGGYVSLVGEDEADKSHGSYFTKKVWQKILIVGFGVISNFLLAIIILSIGFMVGMTPLVSDPATMGGQKTSQIMIAEVVTDSPAAKVGIKQGDILEGFASPQELSNFTHSHPNSTQIFKVRINDQISELPIQLGAGDAPLGVAAISITKVKLPFFQAIWASIIEVGKSIATVVVVLWGIIASLFTTGSAGEAGQGVVGPVGIFNFTSQALSLGWIYVLQLAAILSINLGIINILPFPALDGGKIFFLALEGIFRKKVVRQEVENTIHTVGFIILILLVIVITLRDVFRFW